MKQLELDYPAHNYTETSKIAFNKQTTKQNHSFSDLVAARRSGEYVELSFCSLSGRAGGNSDLVAVPRSGDDFEFLWLEDC